MPRGPARRLRRSLALLALVLLAPSALAQTGGPVAYFTLSTDPANTGVPVTADARESQPGPGARIAEYAWAWGNDAAEYAPGNATASSTFSAGGLQNVSLRVTDTEGGVAFFNRTVLVKGAVPDAYFHVLQREEDGSLHVTVNATFSQPSLGARRVVKHEWDFGLGEGYREGNVTEEVVFDDPGQYRISLRVTDDEGRVGVENGFVAFRSTFFERVARVLAQHENLLEGARLTLILAVGTTVAGFVLATVLAMMRVSRHALLRWPAAFYIEVVRGVPLLVLILSIWLALPFVGIRLPILWSGAVALIINTAAYQAEAIRGGIQAIPTGQMEAATSLGMTNMQAMRHVVLPQAFRLTLPPLGNEFIILLKDTSLLSAIGVYELTQVGKVFSGQTFLVLETWVVIAAIYFVMTYSLSLGLRHLEKRLAIPGLGMGGASH